MVLRTLKAYDNEYRAAKKDQEARTGYPIWMTVVVPIRPRTVYTELDFGAYSELMGIESKVELYKKIKTALS